MVEDLSTPLKSRKARAEARMARQQGRATLWQRLPIARTLLGASALLIGGVALYLGIAHNPEGGRPSIETGITQSLAPNPLAEALAPADSGVTITAPSDIAGGAKVITVDPDLVALPGEIDPDNGPLGTIAELTEDTANGPLPRISASGVTPFSAYRRASVTPATSARPLVAIVVTGLGLNEAGTLDAIDSLPGTVSLAFAPYGRTLERTVTAARADGHELLLELPLEPFDYPDNDPGPETLLTGQSPRANLDKLFWLLARMGGYVGVINHMGARFTASGGDFSPVMEELGSRGLGYLDDGSSNRSLAARLAATNRVPFSRADLQIDRTPSRTAIVAALDELVARATAEGHAIGIASALPVTIAALSEWSRLAEDKGVLLVPVSALMQ